MRVEPFSLEKKSQREGEWNLSPWRRNPKRKENGTLLLEEGIPRKRRMEPFFPRRKKMEPVSRRRRMELMYYMQKESYKPPFIPRRMEQREWNPRLLGMRRMELM
ncbi:hypothetical protein AMTR_s00029p00160400 [Amborella trichopoda]|uniref:Uncharacterized protein n=1 Tax=Amborella trichopoda TaxID=13333 RepID=W1PP33_AMBTC|nr:hypothetical protein AMTR_s00029p00160400 [Amborella trichopoda]